MSSLTGYASIVKPNARFQAMKKLVENSLPKSGWYLDVGCGKGYGGEIFCEHLEIVNLDIGKVNLAYCKQYDNGKAHFVLANAQYLPFKVASFNLATAFSLIEHLPGQRQFISEVKRVLSSQGVLVMQFPNANFLMEMHTGMPLPNLLPRKVYDVYRHCVLKRNWGDEVNNLTCRRAFQMCSSFFSHIYGSKCNFDKNCIPPRIRGFYRLLLWIGFFNICPLGWILVCKNQ